MIFLSEFFAIPLGLWLKLCLHWQGVAFMENWIQYLRDQTKVCRHLTVSGDTSIPTTLCPHMNQITPVTQTIKMGRFHSLQSDPKDIAPLIGGTWESQEHPPLSQQSEVLNT